MFDHRYINIDQNKKKTSFWSCPRLLVLPQINSLKFLNLETLKRNRLIYCSLTVDYRRLTRRQRLLQFLSLLLIRNDQGVQVARTTNLELGVLSIFLYLDRLGVFPSGLQEEVLDFHDLFRLYIQASVMISTNI